MAFRAQEICCHATLYLGRALTPIAVATLTVACLSSERHAADARLADDTPSPAHQRGGGEGEGGGVRGTDIAPTGVELGSSAHTTPAARPNGGRARDGRASRGVNRRVCEQPPPATIMERFV